MKFAILIHGDEKAEAARSEAEHQRIMAGHIKFNSEMRAAGKMLGGERLRPESESTRLRLKGGQRQITDGPFAETKEALGGFYLVDCASREEAIELASRVVLHEHGFVEVRPVWVM